MLASAGRRPSLTYIYDGDLDWTGHRYGVASPQWQQQLAMIDAAAEQLREALPSTTCASWWSPTTAWSTRPPEHRIDVDEHPELRDGVALLGGEARFRHLYCRGGAVDDVGATLARRCSATRAEVLTRDEAIARGWFGAGGAAACVPRLGDVVVAACDDHAVMSTAAFPYETRLVGLHGSLTSAEMLIPVLVA